MATSTAGYPALRGFEMPTAHPMDSVRLFMTFLSLVRESGEAHTSSAGRQIISVPALRRLLSAMHFRDAGTLKHSRRVGLISVGIAGRLGWDEDDLRIIEIAALLHDIGKIGVPDHILRKPARLSPDEAEYIAVHHRVAMAILQACHAHPEVTEIVAQAHGVDGEGCGGGQAQALGARILAVADAYDSLTTRQSFRAPYDRWEALQILEEQSGKQFDRNVVAALGRWLDSPDASMLADERAAEVSIQVNAPVDIDTRAGAASLCLMFNHLYLLESLYDAFYVIDANRQVVIWNSGAVRMFHRPAQDVLQQKWKRQLVANMPANTDPVDVVFVTGQPQCHGMTIQDDSGSWVDVDVQSIPIHNESGQVAGVVELVCNGKESKQHRGQFRSLQMAAIRDPLTGVFNRGELERRLEELHERWSSDPSEVFAVMFMDLDHFKSINDQLSHAIGDRVLIDTSRLLQDELYSGEIIGRYGGEEFLILCPQTSLEAAVERADRLRRTIMNSRFADRDDLQVTASFGVAQVEPADTVESVVERADRALYDAKGQGRNCTKYLEREADVSNRQHADARTRNNWIHTAAITTCVANETLILKLKGFVEDHDARIMNVDRKQVVLQVGAANLLGNWPRHPARMPVQVTMDISDVPHGQHCRKHVDTIVEPLGRPPSFETFRGRARQVIDLLRSHLLGE